MAEKSPGHSNTPPLIPFAVLSRQGCARREIWGDIIEARQLAYYKAITPANIPALWSWFQSIKYPRRACQTRTATTPAGHPQKGPQDSENHIVFFFPSLSLTNSSSPHVCLWIHLLECLERRNRSSLYCILLYSDSFHCNLGMTLCFVIHVLWEAGKISYLRFIE